MTPFNGTYSPFNETRQYTSLGFKVLVNNHTMYMEVNYTLYSLRPPFLHEVLASTVYNLDTAAARYCSSIANTAVQYSIY